MLVLAVLVGQQVTYGKARTMGAAVGLAVSLSLFGVALGAASAVGGMAESGAWYVVGAVVLGIVALASLLAAAWCTVLVLVPGGETVKPA